MLVIIPPKINSLGMLICLSICIRNLSYYNTLLGSKSHSFKIELLRLEFQHLSLFPNTQPKWLLSLMQYIHIDATVDNVTIRLSY